MKKFLIAIILLAPGLANAEDQWLCLVDEFGTLESRNDAPFKANSYVGTDKLIVSAEGAKWFGQEEELLETCEIAQGGKIVECRSGYSFLTKFPDDAFIFFLGSLSEQGAYAFFFGAGRCAKI